MINYKIFVTSDTHFGHANIIRYCSRPFANVTDMNEALIERWNNRVSKADVVYFLGDFAMGKGVTPEFIANIFARLNGYKMIIMGNHDMPSKYSDGLKMIIEDMHIRDVGIIIDQIYDFKLENKHFIMCHFPLADWNDKHHGAVHLHGHTHTEFNADVMGTQSIGRYDIGVDMYGGPVEITGDLRYLNDPKGWAL